jgi:hypothetical protein
MKKNAGDCFAALAMTCAALVVGLIAGCNRDPATEAAAKYQSEIRWTS